MKKSYVGLKAVKIGERRSPTWPQGNSKHTSIFQTQMIYDSQTQSIVFHVLTFFRVDTNI